MKKYISAFGAVAIALILAACVQHPTPPHGHGGFAEWDWPWQTEDGEVYEARGADGNSEYYKSRSYERKQPNTPYERPDEAGVWYDQPPHGQRGLWSYNVPHPDYLPTVFRTTELRLRRHQEGCAVHYLPAFVVQAEKQWNKALRAFAGELYQDAFHDLRQLNLRLDEIDQRMAIVYGPKGSYTPAGCNGMDPTLPCTRSCVGPAFTGGYCGAIRPGHIGPAVVSPYTMYGCAQGRQKHWPCNNCKTDSVTEYPPAQTVCGQPLATAPGYYSAGIGGANQVPATFNGNYFEFDSDVVSEGFRAYLHQLAAFYGNDQTIQFVLHGHTDQAGATNYNDGLSYRRAQNVARVLVRAGVPHNRISISHFGESRPSAGSNAGPDGKERLNRRVEIFLNKAAVKSFWTGYCSSQNMRPSSAVVSGQQHTTTPTAFFPQHLLTYPLPLPPSGHPGGQ